MVSCIFVCSIAMIFLLRWFWPAVVMLAVMLGITSPSVALGLIIGVVIVGAATLHAKLGGGPF
jgi:hypothetical protein